MDGWMKKCKAPSIINVVTTASINNGGLLIHLSHTPAGAENKSVICPVQSMLVVCSLPSYLFMFNWMIR